MAEQYPNESVLLAWKETTYNVAPGTPTSYADPTQLEFEKIEFKWQPVAVSIPYKNGKIVDDADNQKIGRQESIITIEGNLSSQNADWLFEGYTFDATSPYTIDVTEHVPTTFLLHQVWNITAGDATTRANTAAGAVFTSLVISGGADGRISYVATLRSQPHAEYVDVHSLADYPSTATDIQGTPYLFGDIEDIAVIDEEFTGFNSFTLTMTNEMANDDCLFKNSFTRLSERVMGRTIIPTFEICVDNATQSFAISDFFNDAAASYFTLYRSGSAVVNYLIEMSLQQTDYSTADTERDIQLFTWTGKAVGATPITVTYTAT